MLTTATKVEAAHQMMVEIERLYREAPMLLIGEGTAEFQKMIVARRLLEEYQVTG